jgi:hypothetical protein
VTAPSWSNAGAQTGDKAANLCRLDLPVQSREQCARAEILPGKRAERTYGDCAGHRRAAALTLHIADNEPQAATGLLKRLVEITAHFFRQAVTDTFIG